MKSNTHDVLVPEGSIAPHGHFEVSTRKPGEEWGPWTIDPNLVVAEGRSYILGSSLGGQAQKATFYIALFGGNVTPPDTWTGANFVANATEFTNYDEATRVLWQDDAVAGGIIGNDTNPAVFTLSAGGGTIRGAALVEASAKGATTGILVAASRFVADKVMAVGEELRVKYIITGTSA